MGHLFFNCKMTNVLWWESMRWVRVVGPLSINPIHHLYQFCEGFGSNVNYSSRCGWWIALTISIWQHRNQLIFQGKPFDPYKVMDHAIYLAWSWLKAYDKDFSINFHHWSSNISTFVDQMGLGLNFFVEFVCCFAGICSLGWFSGNV